MAWLAIGLLLASSWSGSALSAHDGLHAKIAKVSQQIREEPSSAPLYLLRGDLHRRHKAWALAVSDLQRAESLQAPGVEVAYLRARLYADLKWTAAALEVLDRALEFHPEEHRLRWLRARQRKIAGKGLPALQDYDLLIARQASPPPDAFWERAQLASEMGLKQRALSGLEAGLARLGEVITLELSALALEEELGLWDAALQRIRRLAAKTPRKERWWLRQGQIHVQAGQPEAAREAFENGLQAVDQLPPKYRRTPAMIRLRQELLDAQESLTESAGG